MARPDSTSPSKSVHNFELVCSLLANNLIPVHKYKSRKTGLTVVVSEVEGPVVNGYFCLATEAHDDDGLPHTLEHLIFLGSEQYPYKGVLDLLANRCLASGTNAWTDTDHTCYTTTNAGSEGFLSLLPIYLDHILFPTLTDSAYTTEVYHVDGDGRDGGVVYSEMQGRENSGESRVYLELLRSMYPGDCGYKAETGGIMKNLRESTNNQKVRAFHKAFYRPENLWVIVVGHVKPAEVLETLGKVEEKILSKGPWGEFVRPWQTPIAPLTASEEIHIPYACDEEVSGMVYVGWRGPCVVTDIYRLTACSILLKYLTDTPVSLLPKEFVEIPDPYASKVSYSLVENLESLLLVQFENVPLDKLSLVRPQLEKVLRRMVSEREPIDMARMATVINRHRLECLSHLENSPHDTIAFIVIGHQLYGNSTQDLGQRLNIVRDLERLAEEGQEFWVGLLERYLLGPSVTGVGSPSMEEQRRLTEEEEARLGARRAALGQKALEQRGKELVAAVEANNAPPPTNMLTAVPIPNPQSIHFHTIKSYHTNMSRDPPALFNLDKVPVYTHLDDLNTNFVYMFVLMDSSRVGEGLMRRYLPLLLECLLESGIERDGVVIPYEEVVAELEADTVATALRIGLDSANRFQCGPYCNTVSLLLQLEPRKYEKGINWIREILYKTVFSEERVRIIATKIINNVAEVKRKGNNMARSLMKALIYRKDSNHVLTSVMEQYKFLTSVVERLERGEGAAVLRELNSVREALTDPSHLVLHLAASLDQLMTATNLADLADPWRFRLLPSKAPVTKNKLQVVADWTFLSGMEDNQVGASGCIVGIGAVDSAFLCLTTKCIKEFYHEDLPALLVFIQYLTQLEGPLWKHVRGKGLAYSYNMMPRPQESLLYLTLYKASNVVGAFQETKQVIENKLQEIDSWDPTLYESAKSSLIFEIIEREKCIGDVVAQSLLSYFKQVSHDYNRDLVRRITAVTVEDLKRVGPMYLSQIFDESQNFNKVSVVCHPSKVDEIEAGLKGLGLNLTKYYNLEESIINQ